MLDINELISMNFAKSQLNVAVTLISSRCLSSFKGFWISSYFIVYVMLLSKHVLYSDVTWGIKKKLLRVVYLMALICDNTPLPSPILTGSQAIPIKLSKSK